MIEAIRVYIQKIVLFGILTTIAYQILPGEKYEKYLKLYTGFLFILIVFLPIIQVSGLEESFQKFYQSYEMNLQYDGEEEKAKEQLYEKYEETLEKQLEQVLEKQGYAIGNVRIETDKKTDGKLQEVTVILQEEVGDEISVPVVQIGEKKALTEEENEQKEKVKQLLETMYQGEEVSIAVQYAK